MTDLLWNGMREAKQVTIVFVVFVYAYVVQYRPYICHIRVCSLDVLPEALQQYSNVMTLSFISVLPPELNVWVMLAFSLMREWFSSQLLLMKLWYTCTYFESCYNLRNWSTDVSGDRSLRKLYNDVIQLQVRAHKICNVLHVSIYTSMTIV